METDAGARGGETVVVKARATRMFPNRGILRKFGFSPPVSSCHGLQRLNQQGSHEACCSDCLLCWVDAKSPGGKVYHSFENMRDRY